MVTKNEMVAILAALTTDFDSQENSERPAEQEPELEFNPAHVEGRNSDYRDQQRKAG